MATTEQKSENKPNAVVVPEIDIRVVTIALKGDSPLICHRWSDKAKAMMLAKQTKAARTPKESKNPKADFEASLYPLPGGRGYGFPAVAFKTAAVRAAKLVDGMNMRDARAQFHIIGELVPIYSPEPPRMREDMVRVGQGVADIRYRGEFVDWWTEIEFSFNNQTVSVPQILTLLNYAGFGTGVGEWRPEKNGSYGRFHVATDEEIEELKSLERRAA